MTEASMPNPAELISLAWTSRQEPLVRLLLRNLATGVALDHARSVYGGTQMPCVLTAIRAKILGRGFNVVTERDRLNGSRVGIVPWTSPAVSTESAAS